MKDKNKTKKQLLEELTQLRRRVSKLEKVQEESQKESQKEQIPPGIDLGILEHAIASSISGIGITDMDGKLIYVNDKTVKMWGYEGKDEILGRYLPEFWEGEGVLETIEHLKKKGARIGEDMGKRKDGSTFYVDYIASVIQDRSGKPKYMIGSFIDNTRRKQIEENLIRAHDELEKKVDERTADLTKAMERLRSIFDSSPDSITVTDENAVIIDCNQATLDNLGYSKKEELIGKKALETIAEKDHDRAMKNLSIAAEKGAVHDIEYEIVRKDGEAFPANISASVIKDASGKMTGFVAIAQNIVLKKRAENALKESEAKLKEQKLALEQKNIALREIIAQIEIEKRKIKDDIATNASMILSPILEKLKTDRSTAKYVGLLRHHVEELTSSLSGKLMDAGTKLTAREVEVCNMIKGGLSNKDISHLLSISVQTVEGHRKNIRKKLGLKNKGINLTAYLRGL
jgi:PAS domain S-box-containing protein